MLAFADGPRIALSPPLPGDVPDVVAPVVPDVVAPVVPDVVAPVVPEVVAPGVPDVVAPGVPDVVAPVDPDVVPALVPAPLLPDVDPDEVCALADTANARAIALARAHRVKVFMSNSSCLRLATPDPIGRTMLARIA
jgi:hypothetical protein